MLYKRGAIWWVQFEHQGTRRRISTGKRDRREASAEARRIRVELEQEAGPSGRGQGITVEVIEALDIARAENRATGERRVPTLKAIWGHLREHIGTHTEVADLTLGTLDDYEGARRAEKWRGEPTRGQTIKREIQALVRGLRLAKRRGLIHRYPFDLEDVATIATDEPREWQEGKPRTPQTIWAVVDALSARARNRGHDRIVWLLYSTGLRREEFWRCNPSWLRPAPQDSHAAELLVVPASGAKTGRSRVLPLDLAAARAIRDLHETFAGLQLSKSLAIASHKAGVSPTLTPRDLRASYLTELARRDPAVAQRLAGHGNLRTTGLYVDADESDAIRTGADVTEALRPAGWSQWVGTA